MDDKELWEEICFYLNSSNNSMSEELYEQKIIMSLEKMGWKHFKGEIILKQSIPVGSAQSIIPDIIVKSQEDNISFVIEVKKPSISLTENNRNQLFSYMRQLKLEFGMLFGEKIQIFYDGELSSSDIPTHLKTIELTNDDRNLDFVKIFKKSALSKSNLEKYAKSRIEAVSSQKEKNDLRKEILSPEFALRLREQAKHILLENWNEQIIDQIIKDFEFSIISTKEEPSIIRPPQPQPPRALVPGRVEYVFDPPDEIQFKKQLIQNKYAYIKIFYKDGREEYKQWDASRFTENSNLRGNINSKTWFRRDYVQRNGVIKAIFSIKPFQH